MRLGCGEREKGVGVRGKGHKKYCEVKCNRGIKIKIKKCPIAARRLLASLRLAAACAFFVDMPSQLGASSLSATNASGCTACTHRMYSSTVSFLHPVGDATKVHPPSLDGLAAASYGAR